MMNSMKKWGMVVVMALMSPLVWAETIDRYDAIGASLLPTGAPSNQTIDIVGMITTRANHMKDQNIYVAAKQPVETRNGLTYNWFFKTPTGWAQWTGGPIPVFMRTKVSGYGGVEPILRFNILKNENVSAFVGTSIFVAAGNDEADMLNNLDAQARQMYTIGNH